MNNDVYLIYDDDEWINRFYLKRRKTNNVGNEAYIIKEMLEHTVCIFKYKK